MQKRFVTWAIPVAFVLFSSVPAFSQVRIGIDFGAVQIRIAPEPPPRPRVERITVRPSRRHVWIRGYWDRQGDQWIWASGRWEEPNHPGSRWIRPQYRHEGGAYRYEPGRWSNQRMVEGEDYSEWRKQRGRGHTKYYKRP
jgi:hypothetical protein